LSDSNARKELLESKLIILYILDRMGMPVPELKLTEIILENKLMNYFLLKQYLDELSADGHIKEIQDKGKTFYEITNSGSTTLGYFHTMMPEGIKNLILEKIGQAKKEAKDASKLSADYTVEIDGSYTVACSAGEDDFSLISFKVSVGSRDDALRICENWNKFASDIYVEILQSLMKER